MKAHTKIQKMTCEAGARSRRMVARGKVATGKFAVGQASQKRSFCEPFDKLRGSPDTEHNAGDWRYCTMTPAHEALRHAKPEKMLIFRLQLNLSPVAC